MNAPAEPDWVPHHGGEFPIDPDQPEPEIMIRYRNGRVVGPLRPSSRRWAAFPAHVGQRVGVSAWDIAAWRLA